MARAEHATITRDMTGEQRAAFGDWVSVQKKAGADIKGPHAYSPRGSNAIAENIFVGDDVFHVEQELGNGERIQITYPASYQETLEAKVFAQPNVTLPESPAA